MAEFEYTAVIRTLGTAGEKYQQLLNSLQAQTIVPQAIIVYIAEGYPLPKETIGTEHYVYVKKGMVAQRALPYDEVQTEWMLFLDDDVYLPPKAVETLYIQLRDKGADVIAPELFENAYRGRWTNLKMRLLGKSVAHKDDGIWAYKITRNGGYSYNACPTFPVYWSQTNAGPCFFCRKETFLSICFQNDLWLDEAPYALPEDQVMFYKMFRKGYGILTWYNSGILHLDAGCSRKECKERSRNVLFSEVRNRIIFWYIYIYSEDSSRYCRILDVLSLSWFVIIRFVLMNIKFRFNYAKVWLDGVSDAVSFIKKR